MLSCHFLATSLSLATLFHSVSRVELISGACFSHCKSWRQLLWIFLEQVPTASFNSNHGRNQRLAVLFPSRTIKYGEVNQSGRAWHPFVEVMIGSPTFLWTSGFSTLLQLSMNYLQLIHYFFVIPRWISDYYQAWPLTSLAAQGNLNRDRRAKMFCAVTGHCGT